MPELFRTTTTDASWMELPDNSGGIEHARKLYLALLAVASLNVFVVAGVVTFYLLLRWR